MSGLEPHETKKIMNVAKIAQTERYRKALAALNNKTATDGAACCLRRAAAGAAGGAVVVVLLLLVLVALLTTISVILSSSSLSLVLFFLSHFVFLSPCTKLSAVRPLSAALRLLQ